MKARSILAFLATALMTLTACDEVAEQDRLVYVKPPEVSRCIIIEDFTGQRCVNCPNATAEIEKLQELYGADTLIAVGIHSGPFGKKPNGQLLSLATEVGNQYYDYWKIQAQPSVKINRGAVLEDPNLYSSAVSEALSKTTPVTLKVEHAYDEASRQLTVKVIGSTAERRAWGITILDMVWAKVSPIERAASICPTPMALMPVMKFSEPKAEARRVTATITQVFQGRVTFR